MNQRQALLPALSLNGIQFGGNTSEISFDEVSSLDELVSTLVAKFRIFTVKCETDRLQVVDQPVKTIQQQAPIILL